MSASHHPNKDIQKDTEPVEKNHNIDHNIKASIENFECIRKKKSSILKILPEACALIQKGKHLSNQIYMLNYLIIIDSLSTRNRSKELHNRLMHTVTELTEINQTIDEEFKQRKTNRKYKSTIVPPKVAPTYDHKAAVIVRKEFYLKMMMKYLLHISTRYRLLRENYAEFKKCNASNKSVANDKIFNKKLLDEIIQEINKVLPVFNRYREEFFLDQFTNEYMNIKGIDELKSFVKNMYELLGSDKETFPKLTFYEHTKETKRNKNTYYQTNADKLLHKNVDTVFSAPPVNPTQPATAVLCEKEDEDHSTKSNRKNSC